MNNAVQDLPSPEHHVRDTGFPEPLSTERNTTLPHPSADTSPHASIEAADVPLHRTSSRLRFHSKHSKTTSKGSLPVHHDHHAKSSLDTSSKAGSAKQGEKESTPESEVSFERDGGVEMLSRGESETGSQEKKRHLLSKLLGN